MNKIFAKAIDEINLPAGCGILLAVSGGIDSMCMAELFYRLSENAQQSGRPGPEFAVAHCNFNLRGDESDGDEDLVRRWAVEHGIKIHVKRFATVEYARERGISIEMAARDLRYTWFEELCREHGYSAAAVAHNANDNAETLMLNLLRGSGMNGLSGMSQVSRIPSGSPGAPLLIRPLLTFTRKQIEGFAFTQKLRYRDDSTNASSEYKRNRIRNEVFPIFETINPSFIRTLNHAMGNFAEAGEIVDDYCKALVPALVSSQPDGSVRINLEALLTQKHWLYLIYYILEPYGFNSAALSSVEDLLSSSRTVSGKTFSSASHKLNMERNHMVISPLSTDGPRTSESRNTDIMAVRGAGTYHFNGRSFKVEILPWSADLPLKQPEGTLIMDAEKLKFPFVLRAWRSGDWLVPLGLRGKKKVSDLFTDLKYSSPAKKSAVMIIDTAAEGLAEAQHIAGVACIRIDGRYKVTGHTKSVIRISG